MNSAFQKYLAHTAAALMVTAMLGLPSAATGKDSKQIQLAQGHGGGSTGSGAGGAGGGSGRGGAINPGGGGGHVGGPGEDSEGRGPQYKPGSGTRGKPVWAQEGIPEVELGRLNVARSPANVLDRQFAEVLRTWNPSLAEPSNITIAQLYSMSVSQFIAYLQSVNFKELTLIDSPLQNLALLKDLLIDGKISLTGVTPYSLNDLAAIFIGVASDKNIPITTDTIIALSKILGITISDPAAVAALAEAVRQAVLVAHG